MRALIQRVTQAQVAVEKKVVGDIKSGLLVLLGIEKKDSFKSAEALAHRVLHYRVFNDANQHMNLNIQQVHGHLLVVSQFTLAANTQKGLRPSFSEACPPEQAEILVSHFIKQTAALVPTQSGIFGADMQISLVNDGPVTFILEAQ